MKILTKLLTLNFDFRLFVLLVIGFIAFTIIGTVSHESGHYLVARMFGFKSSIHYNYTSLDLNQNDKLFYRLTWIRYRDQIKAGQPFPEKDRFDRIMNGYKRMGIWFTLGGPLQTMLTGTLGLILMIIYRKRYFASKRLSFWLWLIIFTSLFWLRQTANFISEIGSGLIRGYIRSFGDESYVARHYHLPFWSVSAITAMIGVIILAIVIFRFIPIKQRLTFITAGLFGGVSGFVFWLVVFGKIIMH
jgi:hypothetical protein